MAPRRSLLGSAGAGRVEASDAMDGRLFPGNFDITGYASTFQPYGMVIGPEGKLYVANRFNEFGRAACSTRRSLDWTVRGSSPSSGRSAAMT
jgi:hypothetical protein